LHPGPYSLVYVNYIYSSRNGSIVVNAEGWDGSHNWNGTWTVEKAGSSFLVTHLDSQNEASGFLGKKKKLYSISV